MIYIIKWLLYDNFYFKLFKLTFKVKLNSNLSIIFLIWIPLEIWWILFFIIFLLIILINYFIYIIMIAFINFINNSDNNIIVLCVFYKEKL